MKRLLRVAALAMLTAVLIGGRSAVGSNAGDIWVDLPGHTGDPGHENDPHICGQVEIYGAGLAEHSNTFEVRSWPPTGDRSVVMSGTWVYSGSGNQPIAGPLTLAPGHYKVTVNQNPVKQKVFWVCAPPAPTPTPVPSGAPWPFGH